jgi:glycosyltransferase involved in cell wall biosynthesis
MRPLTSPPPAAMNGPRLGREPLSVPRLSICMPLYNGARWVRPTLDSLLGQSFGDFELIVADDGSTDDSAAVVEAVGDPRIRVARHPHRGYSLTLRDALAAARGEVVVLMGGDDLVCDGMLQRIYDVFARHPNVGALTRAYYWFQGDLRRAVRVKPPVSAEGDAVLSLRDAQPDMLFRAFSSMDQLSGLAMRRAWIDCPVHEHIFTAHVYPMASIMRRHDLYCIRDNTIAVRIESSQCRSIKGIYDPSPVWTWARLFETVYPEEEFRAVRGRCIRDFVARNHVGLVQIRNFGRYRWLLREIAMLLRYRPLNAISPSFWFFSLGCMALPPALLLKMVDFYKTRVLSRSIGSAPFEYTAGRR